MVEQLHLLLAGPRAVPPPRLAKLLASLQSCLSDDMIKSKSTKLSSISAYFIHLTDAEKELSEQDKDKLAKLLHYGTAEDNASVPQDEADVLAALSATTATGTSPNMTTSAQLKVIVVLPRAGTISPWSSKATDIARICDLAVHRIERAICYILKFDGAPAVAVEDGKWLELLHDRMIERAVGLEDWKKHKGGWADFVFRKGK